VHIETQIETLYYTTKHVLRGLHLDEEKQALKDRRPLKRGPVHIKFSMTRLEKGDLLIQVTAWAGLTIFCMALTEVK
jgi:hypothetical protein